MHSCLLSASHTLTLAAIALQAPLHALALLTPIRRNRQPDWRALSHFYECQLASTYVVHSVPCPPRHPRSLVTTNLPRHWLPVFSRHSPHLRSLLTFSSHYTSDSSASASSSPSVSGLNCALSDFLHFAPPPSWSSSPGYFAAHFPHTGSPSIATPPL